MKVTPETLTADRLKMFRLVVRDEIEELLALHRDLSELIEQERHSPELTRWREARERVAAAWNAREGGAAPRTDGNPEDEVTS